MGHSCFDSCHIDCIVRNSFLTFYFRIIVLFITKLFIGCVLWTFIFLSILFCLIVAGFCFVSLYFANNKEFLEKYSEKAGPQAAAKFKKFLENKKMILLIGIGFTILGVIISILVCVKRKAISVATGVIALGADYVFDHPMLFIIMLICFSLQVITFSACLYGILVIHTHGKSHSKETGSPFPDFDYTPMKWARMIFFGIGTYWVSVFWNNVCDFAVSAAAVDDYFKKEVGTCGEFFKAFTLHFGTIAYGSLVLGPIGFFNLLFGWIHALVRDDDPNFLQNFFGYICCICCWPYEKLCLRVDDNVFAMVALTQLNFCPAGKKNFYLDIRIGEQIGNAGAIGFIYGLCGRIGIASLTTWISYFVFKNVEYFSQKIHNVLIPTFVIFYFFFLFI